METGKGQTVTIRVFGFLQRYMDEQGMPYKLERDALHMILLAGFQFPLKK